jgi:hypothetical protein
MTCLSGNPAAGKIDSIITEVGRRFLFPLHAAAAAAAAVVDRLERTSRA